MLTHEAPRVTYLPFSLKRLQGLAAFVLRRRVDLTGQAGSSGAGALAIPEDVHIREIHLCDELPAYVELRFSFAGEADNHVSGNSNVGNLVACRFHHRPELALAGAADHAPQRRIAATFQL